MISFRDPAIIFLLQPRFIDRRFLLHSDPRIVTPICGASVQFMTGMPAPRAFERSADRATASRSGVRSGRADPPAETRNAKAGQAGADWAGKNERACRPGHNRPPLFEGLTRAGVKHRSGACGGSAVCGRAFPRLPKTFSGVRKKKSIIRGRFSSIGRFLLPAGQ